jgi:hypothetical protein
MNIIEPMDYKKIEILNIPLKGIDLKPMNYFEIKICNIDLKNDFEKVNNTNYFEIVDKMWKVVFSCKTQKQLDSAANILNFHIFNSELKYRIQFIIDRRRKEIKDNN